MRRRKLLCFLVALMMVVSYFSMSCITVNAEWTAWSDKAGPAAGQKYDLNGLNPDDAMVKPLLIVNTREISLDEAKAQSVWDVTISVKGAADKYGPTGLHIQWDPRLKFVPWKVFENRTYYAHPGDAGEYLSYVEQKWGDNGLFLTTCASDDVGQDGVLWKFQFELPDNLEGGEEFPIQIVYCSTSEASDLFNNKYKNEEGMLMQAYVFTKGIVQGGIRIKEDTTPWAFRDFSWEGDATSGYTKASAVYARKYSTRTVEADIQTTVTEPKCEIGGKTTYKAVISAEDSLDGIARESDVMEALTTPETGHDWRFDGFSWTGDETTGYTAITADYVCKNDSDHKKSVDVIPQTAITDPTCESDGKTTYVASISADDSLDKKAHEESKDALVTKALGYDWKFIGFNWTGDETNGYTAVKADYVCKNDESQKKSVDVTPQVTVTDPTCVSDGKTTYAASISASDSLDKTAHEESKDALVTKALGHEWKFTGFSWTGDETTGYTEVTADYVCKNDDSHKNSVNVTPQVDVVPPTSETEGKTTYKVNVSESESIDGIAHNDSKVVVKRPNYRNEWVDGQWYDENGGTSYTPQGSWKEDELGKWYGDTANWYPVAKWQKIDHKWYYFDGNGYLAENQFERDWAQYSAGFWWVGKDGVWDGSDPYTWHLAADGRWWFGQVGGKYVTASWQHISGKWYYFDKEGYLLTKQYIDSYWVNEDGEWVP